MNPRIKKIEQEIDKLKGKVACGAWMFRRMSWRRCFVRFAAAHRCRRTI